MIDVAQAGVSTYENPVYNHSCPDPFALKYNGEYWCYCTGLRPDGRCFGIFHSRNLVHWEEVGSAMDRLPNDWPNYWAPEVTYENGRFYMYYSAGNELPHMEIRVAIATNPAGPFIDSGRRLTSEEFAIDPHVFIDDDGSRYLFYAVDFLDYTHIGTGAVADRMLDPLTLAGNPKPVTRARYDWQVYDPHRIEKGGVRWHTVEGSFVLKHKGKYYHMFSGGNWQNVSYGVSYATTSAINIQDEWTQVADGVQVLPILRTLPGKVVGPGHNSVVRDPSNRQLFCVYHRWSQDTHERVLAIDRLEFAGDRLMVLGPSTTPQSAPVEPGIRGFAGQHSETGWQIEGGQWTIRNDQAIQEATKGAALISHSNGCPAFTVEITLRALNKASEIGSFGINLSGEQRLPLSVLLQPGTRYALILWQTEVGNGEYDILLPDGFDYTANHLLHIECNFHHARVMLDNRSLCWEGYLSYLCSGIGLTTQNLAAAFSAFELTRGYEDLFLELNITPDALGWQAVQGHDHWEIREKQLQYTAAEPEQAVIAKRLPLAAYEFVTNLRIPATTNTGAAYGFYPLATEAGLGPLFAVRQTERGWALSYETTAGMQSIALPQSFDPTIDQQFRFRKQAGKLTLQLEAAVLATIDAPTTPSWVGLMAGQTVLAVDMVRVTELQAE